VSRLRVNYLDPGGVYRRRWVNQRQEEPVSIVNRKDGQLHVLRGAPIFTKAPPVDIPVIEDLLTVQPLPLSPLAEDRMMLCEEDNPWPVGVMSAPLPADEQKRQLQDMRQEWMQKAKGVARKKSRGDMSATLTYTTVAIALGLGGLIIGLGAKIAFEQDDPAVVPAVADAVTQIIQVLGRLVA